MPGAVSTGKGNYWKSSNQLYAHTKLHNKHVIVTLLFINRFGYTSTRLISL